MNTFCLMTNSVSFLRLQDADPPVLRANGMIMKCLEESYNGYQISNKLQEMLVNEDSENFCLFSEKERDEFLFQLFRHLVIGGSLNQYEDTVEPYLEVSRFWHSHFFDNSLFCVVSKLST